MAGEERFRCSGVWDRIDPHGIIVCYDTTDAESYRSAQKRLQKCLQNPLLWGFGATGHPCTMLVGTKCDSNRKVVEYAIAKDYADELNIPFIECSSLENINIDTLFQCMVGKIQQKVSLSPKSVTPPNSGDKNSCCHM